LDHGSRVKPPTQDDDEARATGGGIYQAFERVCNMFLTLLPPTRHRRAAIGQEHDRPHALRRIMPEHPSGTVTFLFTDIERRTGLWERDPAAMASAVERHLRLLRDGTAVHDLAVRLSDDRTWIVASGALGILQAWERHEPKE
jgi:class 3 adenylate cyclase